MSWPYTIIYRFLYSSERYIWVQVRILHETNKAILIDNGIKIWIPKSRIHGIRLRKNVFEIYVYEMTIIRSISECRKRSSFMRETLDPRNLFTTKC